MWPPSSAKASDRDPGLPAVAKLVPILVHAPVAAAAFSICERAFHSLRRHADFHWDAPVVLGPRCVRFRLEALQVFARSLVSAPRDEPGQLRQSRGKRKPIDQPAHVESTADAGDASWPDAHLRQSR